MNDEPDFKRGDEPEREMSADEACPERSLPWSGMVVPRGFFQSLLPDLNATVHGITDMITVRLREQMAEFVKASVPTFNYIPPISPELLESIQTTTQTLSESLLGDLRKSLGPILDPEVLRGFQRNFLPPNLREHVDEVSAHQVYDFLQQEGIPLYLVPRGATAVRLLQAPAHRARRQVLSDRYESLIDDCEALLSQSQHPAVRDEALFTLDGLGAMRVGHTRSAQALFTVTLDSIICRFYPDRSTRAKITNHQKGADVPDLIDSMGVHQAFVWLPVWNAHEQFWKDRGDSVPHNYSRHASVHGVSKRQFNKRNCVQSLMLVTSLIGYADRLANRSSSR